MAKSPPSKKAKSANKAKSAKKKSSKKKSSNTARRYSEATSHEVEKEMRRYNRGTAKSSSGRKVKSRKQAIAIALSKSREKGMKLPKRAAKKRK